LSSSPPAGLEPIAPSELGSLRDRFEVGRADQRTVAVVRGVAALLSGACAVLLLLADLPIPVFMAAVLGVLMSLVWWAQGRRAARIARSPHAHSLAIYDHGFVIRDGAEQQVVRFADLASLAVDEERLDIVAVFKASSAASEAADGARNSLRIEPRYPGLAIHELVSRLQSAADADSHHVGER
jgi:hypothetical protein